MVGVVVVYRGRWGFLYRKSLSGKDGGALNLLCWITWALSLQRTSIIDSLIAAQYSNFFFFFLSQVNHRMLLTARFLHSQKDFHGHENNGNLKKVHTPYNLCTFCFAFVLDVLLIWYPPAFQRIARDPPKKQVMVTNLLRFRKCKKSI